MDEIDPNHEFTHRVVTGEMLDEFIDGARKDVEAFCGKVWAPTKIENSKKPLCVKCFPQTYPYAMAS